ncbi:hypothetical protein F0562_022900 [Nyssa sinensis]|uniref:Uncharacterized protein n=1 Tax=Nyssa sinensis TaxID=561372 RepID=A0A5J5BGJ8_9ASTE|nr:hypothetical protein F0562_022900 [Nyssa sinensis]
MRTPSGCLEDFLKDIHNRIKVISGCEYSSSSISRHLGWKAQINATLEVYDFLSYVNGSIPMPSEKIEVTTGNATEMIANPRFTEWKKAN